MTMKKSLLILTTTLLLPAVTAGCASQFGVQETIDGPFYTSGYTDGCTSAREAEKPFSTKIVQDKQLFRDDASYRSGWRQGFSSCKTDRAGLDPDNDGSGFDPF